MDIKPTTSHAGMRLASVTLLALMTIVWGYSRSSTIAQQILPVDAPVCGDAEKADDEECDDGNLRESDGCSRYCTLEVCGNGRIDGYEQCDDGNAIDDDTCSTDCYINFCGDGVVQTQAGEQCDDGNRQSSDECSASCQLTTPIPEPEPQPNEQEPQVAEPNVVEAQSDPSPAHPAAPVDIQSTSLTELQQQAIIASDFLFTTAGEMYTFRYLTLAESQQLAEILQALREGKALTPEQQKQAGIIALILIDAKAKEGSRYVAAVRGFFRSPSGQQVLRSLGFDPALAETDSGFAQIDAALRANGPMSQQEGERRTASILDSLEQQSVSVDALLASRFQSAYLRRDSVDKLIALYALRDDLERQAGDASQAMSGLHREIAALLEDFATVEREFDAQTAQQLKILLIELETMTADAKPQSEQRIVEAFNSVLSIFRTQGLNRSGLTEEQEQYMHAAASIQVQADAVDFTLPDDAPRDPLSLATSLAAGAPAPFAQAFATGGKPQQVSALLAYLDGNERIAALRAIVRESGNATMDQAFVALRASVAAIGDDASSQCGDTIESATLCVQEYLSSLEQAARNRSALSRIAGTLREFFGLDSHE